MIPRQNFDAVADLAWGLILSVMRKIVEGDKNIRSGHWCDGVARGIAVSKKTLGIIGFGAIGQAVARRGTGFDMNIIYDNLVEEKEIGAKYNAEYVSRERIFKEADIIISTCPLTDETYHLINADSIALMKPTAVVINPSRGGVVDTQALYEALKNGRIAGAG